MKTKSSTYLLVALLSASSLFAAAPKEQPAKTPLLVIPGDPGRPYEVIDNTLGVFEVIYKVTFTNGVGAKASYSEALLEALDIVRGAAKKAGADAVIHTQIDYVPLTDSTLRDEAKFRGQQVIGLIKIFGTQVKFLPTSGQTAQAGK